MDDSESTTLETLGTKQTTGVTVLDGKLPYSPGVLLELISNFTGQSPPSGPSDAPKLELRTLEQLCPGIKRKNIAEDLRDRKLFAKLGQWTDKSKKFTVGLAYTFGCEDPWQAAQYIPHHLVAYLIPNTQTSYPHESKWSISITIHISEPELEARLLGLVREKNKISDSTEALSEFPCMIELNSRNWQFLRKLYRYHSQWNFSSCSIIFTLDWTHTVVRAPDVSGIMHVLRVPELMLVVCNCLDLRSIESLRQTCKYFRGMEPLAAVGSTRLRNTFHRAFGGETNRRSKEQTTQLIQEFTSLLLAGGSIVGGSTALHLFAPGNWLPADTDIIVRESHRDAMKAFLVDKVGLVFNEERSQNAESFYPGQQEFHESELGEKRAENHIRFTYLRYDSPIDGQPGVDLCVIHRTDAVSAPADFVLTYHSTVVMNFWNGQTLRCLSPDLTVAGQLIRNEYTPTPKVEAALKKYIGRGYFDKYDPRPAEPSARWMDNPHPLRYIQDNYPKAKGQKLTVDIIRKIGRTWRGELMPV